MTVSSFMRNLPPEKRTAIISYINLKDLKRYMKDRQLASITKNPILRYAFPDKSHKKGDVVEETREGFPLSSNVVMYFDDLISFGKAAEEISAKQSLGTMKKLFVSPSIPEEHKKVLKKKEISFTFYEE